MIAYCDTSFILEFWQAFVGNEDDPFFQLQKSNRPKYFDFIKSLLKTESRHEKLKRLRRLINNYEVETNLISSFFALTELYEKHAEWNFKATIAEATSIDRIFSKGKKEIGDFIAKVYKSKDNEADLVFGSLFPHELEDSLYGIEFRDLENFNLSNMDFHSKYSIFSILQLGTTDILHLIAAKHLGANYFLTFDNDFVRVKDIIKDNMNMEVVFTHEELDAFIKKLPPTEGLNQRR